MTDLLEKHFAPLRNPSNDSDWLDVRRRARRPWRRAVLVAVVAATVALLVAPAFGVGGRVLDLIQGKPAPPPVQTSFVGGNAARQQRFAFAAAAGLALHDRFRLLFLARRAASPRSRRRTGRSISGWHQPRTGGTAGSSKRETRP
jgi:hypothetical protein